MIITALIIIIVLLSIIIWELWVLRKLLRPHVPPQPFHF